MGCKNTKVGVESTSKKLDIVSRQFISSVTIDHLPVENIYRMLDELDTCTVFTSLCSVCNYFNSILSTDREYHLNLKFISLTSFELICSCIRLEKVTKLTASGNQNTLD